MSLEYILRRTAANAGIELSDSSSRALLVDVINEAAEEVWEETDLPGSLKECFISASTDRIIALPAYFGELKAVRSACLGHTWTMQDMRPRYHANPWPSLWNKFRHLGYSPILADVVNSAPFSFRIAVADPDLSVSISGATSTAARDRETIVMTGVDVLGTKGFIDVESITLSKIADNNVEVYDADGNLLSIIFNNNLEARYSLYDITGCPFIDIVVETLYKMRLSRLENDADTFPVPDFDNIVVMKVKQLFAEEQDGQEDRAILMHKKVQMRIEKKEMQKEGTNEKNIGFAFNSMLGMFHGQNGSRRNHSQ